jgi:hypothetical protein
MVSSGVIGKYLAVCGHTFHGIFTQYYKRTGSHLPESADNAGQANRASLLCRKCTCMQILHGLADQNKIAMLNLCGKTKTNDDFKERSKYKNQKRQHT